MYFRLTRLSFSVVGTGVFGLFIAGRFALRAAEPTQDSSLRTIAAEGHSEGIFCVAYNPDGTRLATGGGEGEVFVWDTVTWRPVLHLQADAASRRAHTDDVWGVSFSADGKRLVTAGQSGAALWETTSGQELRRLKGEYTLSKLAFRPDGKQAVWDSGAAAVKVWFPVE